jgi:hypothetical protein
MTGPGRVAEVISEACQNDQHGWCANRTPEETHCGCACHRLCEEECPEVPGAKCHRRVNHPPPHEISVTWTTGGPVYYRDWHAKS